MAERVIERFPRRPQPGDRGRLLTAFAALYLVWGSTYLAIRYAIDSLPPFLMAGARFVVAGAALTAWAMLRGAERPTLRQWRSTAIVGAFLLLGGNAGVVWAEQRVPSGLAALLVATVPLWMVVIDRLRPGGRHPGARVLVGVALGLAGVAILVGRGEFAGGRGIDPAGAVVLIAASLAWALGSIYAKSASLPASPLLATGMEMLCGGLLLVAAGSVAGEWAILDLARVTLRSWLALGYLVTFGSLIGFTAYIYVLARTTPAMATTYAFVNPVVAVFLGWAFAGEPVSPRTLLAAAVIVAAVVVITVFDAGKAGAARGRAAAAPADDSPRLRRAGEA
jgi:drug/metabolite transporter (DMT)-like permease